MKRVYKDSVHWSAAETKSARDHDDKPRVNRGLCSSTGLHSISIFRAFGESTRTVFYDALESKRIGSSGRTNPPVFRPGLPCADPPLSISPPDLTRS